MVSCVNKTLYLDYNATTPLDSGVRACMDPFLGSEFGNPSSIHHVGRRVRAWLDEARCKTAELWGCKPHEVVFTSGGTESNNLAVMGTARLLKTRGNHLICSPMEHPAVLHAVEYLVRREGFEATWLKVDEAGRVDPEEVRRAIQPTTILATVMAANNETGVLQPVEEIGAICREAGVLFHTDAVQWFGKLPFNDIGSFKADLVTVCAHKFHGPKGAGAIYIRSPIHPDPLQLGGPQENERRAGTENLAAIAGLVKSMELFWKNPVFEPDRLNPLVQELRCCVAKISGSVIWTPAKSSLSNTLAFSVEGTDSLGMLAALDLEGICASSGSACSAGSITPSHVLKAMGARPELANALVRFSLGRENTAEEISKVLEVLPKVVNQVRRRSI